MEDQAGGRDSRNNEKLNVYNTLTRASATPLLLQRTMDNGPRTTESLKTHAHSDPKHLAATRRARRPAHREDRARLKVPTSAIRTWAVLRRSLDAREKPNIAFVHNIGLTLVDGPKREQNLVRRLGRQDIALIKPQQPVDIQPGSEPLRHRPVIVGFGPAGMFAALHLAECGYSPIVLERGQPVHQRHKDVYQRFYQEEQFDPESNLLFGEGGAGTYSDGKLYSRIGDPRTERVYSELCTAGADPQILIDGKPHIGSDRLPLICTRIREKIERLGGEIRFGAKVTDLARSEDGRIAMVILADGTQIETDAVILATGHSARDVYQLLHNRHIELQAKPFQMGLRIQHPQQLVDRWQYGTLAGHPKLPPAEYRLVANKAGVSRGRLLVLHVSRGHRPASQRITRPHRDQRSQRVETGSTVRQQRPRRDATA